MVKSVYVPEAGGIIDFPDEATPQQMSAYVQAKYGMAQEAAPAAPTGPDDSSILGRAAYGFARGFTDIPGGIAALAYPAEEAAQTSGGRFSEEARKYLQETLGIDPEKDPTAAQQAAEALGSLASFLVPATGAAKGVALLGKGAQLAEGLSAAGRSAALVGKTAARAGTATAAAQGAALGAAQRAEKIQQQLASGMEISPEQQLAAQRLDAIIGLGEAAPIERFLGPLATMLGKVPASKAPLVERILQSRFANVAKAGGAEALQEAASGVANDLVEYGVYNPDVQIGQDILSNAGTGAFAGSLVEGIVQIAAGRKLRPYRQLQKDIAAEQGVNAQALRQSEISKAAEELRSMNVEGNVDIADEEFDGIPRVVIKTPAGNSIGNFLDRSEAEAAVETYKLRTGAKIALRTPEEAPGVFPVKINGKKFNSLDDIAIEREGLAAQVGKIREFATNPDLLKQMSEKNKVSPDFYKGVVDTSAKKIESKILKLDEFVATTQAREPIASPALTEEGVALGETIAPEEAPAEEAVPAEAVAPEPITEDFEPIGAVTPEAPVEEARFIEPETPIGTIPAEEAVPTRTEGRPTATAEQLSDLQTELFGAPKNIRDMTPEELSTYTAERDKRFPQEDVALYAAGPLPEAVRPRTLSEVDAVGPNIREYTPEAKKWYSDVLDGLNTRLEGIVPNNAKVRLNEFVQSEKNVLISGQARTEQTPNGMKSIVDLTTHILRPGMTVEEAVNELSNTLNHEIIHVLRDQGVIRPAEWRILSKAAQETNVYGKSYTYLDKAQAVYTPRGEAIASVYETEDAVIEEAVADMYRDWVKNKKAPPQTRGLFNRITEFFRRIFRAVKSSAYEKVFSQIESGDVGARTDVTPRETAVRLQAAPLPPYIQSKNATLFRPAPDVPFHRMVMDYFMGPPITAKTLKTAKYGDIELSRGTMRSTAFRQGYVDKNDFVALLEKARNMKDTGNFDLEMADTSATASLTFKDRSSQATIATIMLGDPTINFARAGDIQSATFVAKESNDSLLNVFKVMMKEGPVDPATGKPTDLREIFKSYATAIRARNKKAAGEPVPKELDDTYINTVIPFTQQNYPEVVEAYQMYQRVNKNVLKVLRDSGRISDAELANLSKNMDYYGFYREIYAEELVPGIASKTAGKFKLREYTGSEHGDLINDPMFVMIQNMQYLIDASMKNLAVTKVFNLARDMGEARLLGTSEQPDPGRGESTQVMFFHDKGVLKRFAVRDPGLVMALGSDERADIGSAMRHLSLPTHIIRESVTRDPAFMIANLLRDTVSSWITSSEDITPFIGTAKGMAGALKQSSSFQALMGRGVVGSYDLAMQGPAEVAATIRRRITPVNVHSITSIKGLNSVINRGWDRLGVWSEASDAATRIAVYDAAIAQGMSEAEASFRAIKILDFSRRGGSQLLSVMTKLIPFLNARIQGLDVLYQAGAAGARVLAGKSISERDAQLGKKFLVRGSMLAAISLGLEMLNDDDEDYKDLPDYVKNSNLLIPLKDLGLKGEFIAIPKPFEAGLLFSTLPQQFYKTMAGEASARENINLFVSSFGSTFGVNPIPQILLPALEVMVNHDFYTGLPLVSEGKARLAPELQYDSRTSSLAMMLSNIPLSYNMDTGKFEGLSPITIDNLIGGYAGPFGSLLVDAVGVAMEGLDAGPERMPKDLSQMPVIKRFFVDAESKSPKTVSQAYELFRIVDEANRSFSRLRQIGDAEAIKDFLDENKTVLSYKKYVFKLTDRLNKLSAYERQIERDNTMTDAEKLEAKKRLRETRLKLTEKVSEINAALGR